MSEPQVTLHDVSVDGDVGDRDAVVAAVQRAVEAASAHGTVSPEALRAAISTSLSAKGRGMRDRI